MTKMNDEKKAYEERLRRRLKILQKEFENGKIKIRKGLNIEKSLLVPTLQVSPLICF